MAVQEQWGGQIVHGGCQAGYYNFWNSCGCCNNVCGMQYPCHGQGVHNKRACPVNTYNPVKSGSQGMWSRCRSCPDGTDTRGQSASTKCYWSGTDTCAIGC